MVSAMRTLVLDQNYNPHRIVSWQRAMSLIFTDKAEVVEEYDDELPTVTVTFRMPAVIRLLRKIPFIKKGVKFSRINILTRDKFSCQYCGVTLGVSQVTYDHVVPKSRGGLTTWTNIVSSCYPCNGRKRNRTPDEAGMKLRSIPVQPKTLPLIALHMNSHGSIPDVWASYLYWQGQLDSDNT